MPEKKEEIPVEYIPDPKTKVPVEVNEPGGEIESIKKELSKDEAN